MPIDTVIHTNQHSIDRVLNAGVPVVFVFGQDESQAGKKMDSLLDEAARRNAGILLIARIDASAEEQLLQRYSIQQLPTLVLVKEGATVATVPGVIGKADLNAWFKYLVDGGDRPAAPSRDAASSNGAQQASHSGGGKPFTLTDVDENPRTSQQYGIMSIPALYIFKNGQPVDQIVGAQPVHVLRQRLAAQV